MPSPPGPPMTLGNTREKLGLFLVLSALIGRRPEAALAGMTVSTPNSQMLAALTQRGTSGERKDNKARRASPASSW